MASSLPTCWGVTMSTKPRWILLLCQVHNVRFLWTCYDVPFTPGSPGLLERALRFMVSSSQMCLERYPMLTAVPT